MARNYAGKQAASYDYTQLQTSLVNSGLQKDNPALYNAITKIISGAADFQNGISGARKKSDPIDVSTEVTGILNPLNGGISSGSYFPNVTPVANIAAFSTYYSHVMISRYKIQVYGKLNIQPTAPGVLTIIEIELPIHSKFDSADQLQGVINGIPLGGATSGFAGIITGNVTTGAANIQFFPTNGDNHDCRFMLSYELV